MTMTLTSALEQLDASVEGFLSGATDYEAFTACQRKLWDEIDTAGLTVEVLRELRRRLP